MQVNPLVGWDEARIAKLRRVASLELLYGDPGVWDVVRLFGIHLEAE